MRAFTRAFMRVCDRACAQYSSGDTRLHSPHVHTDPHTRPCTQNKDAKDGRDNGGCSYISLLKCVAAGLVVINGRVYVVCGEPGTRRTYL